MDQKNTIVKCKTHPDCLFNHNGVCDNYVINIGADRKCECYVETASEENMKNGVIGEYKGLTLTEKKVCHPDCIHFDDSDIMVGPICLFQHPEPLKNFYEGVPCDYYHKRSHRAKCNIYDDAAFNLCSSACHYYDFKGACLYCQLRQEYLGPERLMKPCDLFVKAENDKVAVKMKVAEFNKPNKNKSIISDWYYAVTLDICKTCKKVVYGQPCEYKNVVNGVWTCYEEEIDEV